MQIFWKSGFKSGAKSLGIFFSGNLDSCCLDAKKIFKTEINVLFDE